MKDGKVYPVGRFKELIADRINALELLGKYHNELYQIYLNNERRVFSERKLKFDIDRLCYAISLYNGFVYDWFESTSTVKGGRLIRAQRYSVDDKSIEDLKKLAENIKVDRSLYVLSLSKKVEVTPLLLLAREFENYKYDVSQYIKKVSKEFKRLVGNILTKFYESSSTDRSVSIHFSDSENLRTWGLKKFYESIDAIYREIESSSESNMLDSYSRVNSWMEDLGFALRALVKTKDLRSNIIERYNGIHNVFCDYIYDKSVAHVKTPFKAVNSNWWLKQVPYVIEYYYKMFSTHNALELYRFLLRDVYHAILISAEGTNCYSSRTYHDYRAFDDLEIPTSEKKYRYELFRDAGKVLEVW